MSNNAHILCEKCQGTLIEKSFKVKHSNEIVSFSECSKCGAIENENIERPNNMVLKKKHGASEIKISENEKRNLAFLFFQLLEKQNKILATIAAKPVNDDVAFDDLQKIIKRDLTGQDEFKTLLELDDLDSSADRN